MHSNSTWERLLDRLADGESLTAICADSDMPGTSTVYLKIENDAEFSGRFHARKKIGVRKMVDDTLAIADEPVAPGDQTAVANKRVRIDTRLRLAGKWLASEFGERVDVTSGGEKLISETVAVEQAARLASIMAAAAARKPKEDE